MKFKIFYILISAQIFCIQLFFIYSKSITSLLCVNIWEYNHILIALHAVIRIRGRFIYQISNYIIYKKKIYYFYRSIYYF